MTTTETLRLRVSDGTEMQAFVARPEGGRRPALLVLQEAFGVDKHIKDVAERFAREGFLAISPELFHRTAKKDGRRVVILRCFDRDDACIVECDVYPTNSLRVEPLHPGPYTFTSRDEASGFIEEALLALEYLGCDIS